MNVLKTLKSFPYLIRYAQINIVSLVLLAWTQGQKTSTSRLSKNDCTSVARERRGREREEKGEELSCCVIVLCKRGRGVQLLMAKVQNFFLPTLILIPIILNIFFVSSFFSKELMKFITFLMLPCLIRRPQMLNDTKHFL